MLELTVPWEDWIEETHEHMKAKYVKLLVCRHNWWKSMEVGCIGFSGESLQRDNQSPWNQRRAGKKSLHGHQQICRKSVVEEGNL